MKSNSCFVRALSTVIGLAGCVATLHAAPLTYVDYATWSAAVGAQTATTIPDPAPDAFITFGVGDASVTYDGVTFSTSSGLSDGVFFNVGPLFSGAPAVLSSQGQSFGVANILITLPSPVNAFSLNYGYGTFGGSDVTFTLGNGDSFTQASTPDGYDTVDFVGVTDSIAFSTILVTSPDLVLNINNLVTPSTAVPEAGSSFLLLCLAVSGLAAFKRLANRLANPVN